MRPYIPALNCGRTSKFFWYLEGNKIIQIALEFFLSTREEHTPEELAEAMVFPVGLTAAEKREAAEQLAAARKKTREEMTDRDRLSLQLFQMKFQQSQT